LPEAHPPGASQIGDDREHAAVRVPVEGQAELSEDRADVGLHGLLRDPELSGDSGIRLPFRHEAEHLAFARGELGQGVVVLRRKEELLHDLGVERRAAVADAFRRLEEVVDVEHAVLEEIAEAAAGADERDGVAALHVLGENEHRRVGMEPADLHGRQHPLVLVGRGHPHVDEGEIRLVLGNDCK